MKQTSVQTTGGEEAVTQSDKRQQSCISVPEDVVFQILLLLSVKSLRRFIGVCKSWSNIISDSLFVNLHLNQSINSNRLKYVFFKRHLRFELDYESLISGQEVLNMKAMEDGRLLGPIITGLFDRDREVWGSCNGLLCILTAPRILVLANPSTRETKTIFCRYHAYKKHFDPHLTLGGGFGYDQVNDDYKVVKINPQILSIDVYSLKKSTWNCRGSFPYRHAKIRGSASRFVNGAIHWLAHAEHMPDDNLIIVAFDLTKEELVEIPAPPNCTDYELNTDGKHLCLTCSRDYVGAFDIMIMETYGVKESWKRTSVRLHSCNFSYFNRISFKVLNFPDSEVALYHLYEGFLLQNHIDKSQRWVRYRIIGEDIGFHPQTNAISYVESLISLGPGSKIVKESKKLPGKMKGKRKQLS